MQENTTLRSDFNCGFWSPPGSSSSFWKRESRNKFAQKIISHFRRMQKDWCTKWKNKFNFSFFLLSRSFRAYQHTRSLYSPTQRNARVECRMWLFLMQLESMQSSRDELRYTALLFSFVWILILIAETNGSNYNSKWYLFSMICNKELKCACKLMIWNLVECRNEIDSNKWALKLNNVIPTALHKPKCLAFKSVWIDPAFEADMIPTTK